MNGDCGPFELRFDAAGDGTLKTELVTEFGVGTVVGTEKLVPE